MSDEIRWLIGIGASLGALIVGAFYRLGGQMRTEIDVVHNRINKVRDEYVRRDDKDKSDARIEQMVKEIRDEQRAYHKDVLQLMTSKRGS